MSAVASAIAELEAKRAQIDDAIAVLRRVDGTGNTVTVVAAAPAKPAGGNGKPRAAGPARFRKGDADQAAKVRELYERGVSGSEIEKQTGVKAATVYYRASAGGWKRTKAPIGEQLPGKVRCPSCELWTEHDPCSNCGKKVRK